MKGTWIITVMALLNAGHLKAGDYTGTNRMPEQIHNLMDSEGYAFPQKYFGFPKQNTNLLGNLQFVEKWRFVPFVLPIKKAKWSWWNNSSFKYARSNNYQTSGLAPFAAFAHVEYDFSYSFYF